MDPNANANVPGSQPAPAPEAPATPTEPANGTTPSDSSSQSVNAAGAAPQTNPVAGDSGFEPEIQKFLDNQNIKTDDLKAAITELAKRNMKLRGGKPEVRESVADVLNPKAPEPKAPEPPVEPKPTSQPHSLSDMDIANVSMYVKSQCPDVTADAEFYKAMIADGFRPTTDDGQINLKSVMSYANYQQKLKSAEKAIAANQPNANAIPQPSNAPEYAQVDKVQTMTEQAAENIIMFSNTEKRYGRPGHPQYDSAVEFLHKIAREGK